MANYCEVCGKGMASGNNVSHSNKKTRRVWAPNIQRIRAVVRGTPCTLRVCTRCMRSGKVQRPMK